jgi:hypothetical protein
MADPEADVIKVIAIEDEIGVSEVIIGTGEGPSGTSIRRADSQGHSAGVDQRGTQLIETISGRPVQNEEGTPETCQILMERLNQLGGSWESLELTGKQKEEGVDCRLHSNGRDKLEIQVTKADCKIWLELARRRDAGVNKTIEIDAVSDSLLEAIERKRFLSKGPRLVLALEAVHFPVSTVSIAERFIEKYSEAARSFGFHQIWLVGPTAALTFRLA